MRELEKLEDRIAHGLIQTTRAGKLHWCTIGAGAVWETYIDHTLGRIIFKTPYISIEQNPRRHTVARIVISDRAAEELQDAINRRLEKLKREKHLEVLEHATDALEAIVRGDKPPGLYGDPQGKKT